MTRKAARADTELLRSPQPNQNMFFLVMDCDIDSNGTLRTIFEIQNASDSVLSRKADVLCCDPSAIQSHQIPASLFKKLFDLRDDTWPEPNRYHSFFIYKSILSTILIEARRNMNQSPSKYFSMTQLAKLLSA